MSITKETLQQHLKDPAIFCCRREKGLVISEADLEDPGLFDDMEEAGLLTLSPEGLRIEQVLGSTLLTDVEALTPITKEVVDKVNDCEEAAEPETPAAPDPAEAAQPPVIRTTTGGNGMIHIEIDKASNLEGFKLDVPVGGGVAAPAVVEAPEDLSQYGLEEPFRTITAVLSDGTQVVIYAGNKSDLLSEYYIKVEGDDNVYLVSSNIVTDFDKDPEDFIDETETETATEETAESSGD